MPARQPRHNLKTISDPTYERFVDGLVQVRREKDLSQADLADRLKVHQSYVAKVELRQRRLDLIEYVRWMAALEADPIEPIRTLVEAVRL